MKQRTFKKSWLAVLVFFVFGFSFSLQAIVVLPLKLEQIARQADIVAHVQFVEKHKETVLNPDTGQEIPVTVNTFKTLEVLKGNPGGTLEVKQLGTSSRREAFQYGVLGMYDVSQFETGKEYILCLSPLSKLGFRFVIGYQQGRFDVEKNAQGKSFVVNPYGNEKLFQGLQRKNLNLSKSEQAVIQAPPGPVPYDDFSSLLKKILKN